MGAGGRVLQGRRAGSGGKEREERGLWRFKVKERLGGDRGERKVRRKRG